MIGSVAEQLAATAAAISAHGPAVVEHGIVRPARRLPLAEQLTATAALWSTRAVVHAAHAAAVRGDTVLAAGYRAVAVGRFHHDEERRAAA